MNPNDEISRLLRENGAKHPIRTSKHIVWEVNTPNGPRKFVHAHTTSDSRRAGYNNLSILRKLLGIRKGSMNLQEALISAAEKEKGEEMKEALSSSSIPKMEEKVDQPTSTPTAPPPPRQEKEKHIVATSTSTDICHRIELQLATMENEREGLYRRVEEIDQQVKMLEAIRPFAVQGGAGVEAMLASLLSTPKASSAPPRKVTARKSKAVAHPPATGDAPLTHRDQVSAALVWAATQSYGENEIFTTTDVCNRMIDAAAPDERPMRQAISAAMNQLHKQCKLVIVGKDGNGNQWRKVGARS